LAGRDDLGGEASVPLGGLREIPGNATSALEIATVQKLLVRTAGLCAKFVAFGSIAARPAK
jgi:hypothetical protein